MRDANQFNEDLPYVFEKEIPHFSTATQLEALAIGGCHLCSLLWHHLSLERYGTLAAEVDLEQKRLAEESRVAAREQIKGCTEQLFARIFVDDPGTPAFKSNYAGIVLYAGTNPKALPKLRSTLCLWPTKVVECKFVLLSPSNQPPVSFPLSHT